MERRNYHSDIHAVWTCECCIKLLFDKLDMICLQGDTGPAGLTGELGTPGPKVQSSPAVNSHSCNVRPSITSIGLAVSPSLCALSNCRGWQEAQV